MGKSTKNTAFLSALFMLVLGALLGVLSYVYMNFTERTYGIILLVLMLATVAIMVVFLFAVLAVFYVHRRKRAGRKFLFLYRLGIRIFMPIVTALAGVINFKTDEVRRFYIELNNIIVESCGQKYKPSDILVLLPHCLQHSTCTIKITNDIGNCINCGKCCIGGIREISEKAGISVSVATGGTLARSIVYNKKPSVIISVACERDLASGIEDIGTIPVIGILNERPYGPCHDTTININEFEKKLKSILY